MTGDVMYDVVLMFRERCAIGWCFQLARDLE
jgi:hypothetical protein